MNSKLFIDLVYKSIIYDDFNIWDACLAVKDHHAIEDEIFLTIIKQEKTLKADLMNCCQFTKLLKGEKKSKNIENLF